MDIRSHFPIFTHQPDFIYLDSAATALKPQAVIDAINEYYSHYSSNIHRGLYPIAEQATQAYESARQAVADFLHASSSDEIIFTSSTTDALNKLAFSLESSQILNTKYQILTTNLEHHSNLLPWQELCSRTNASLQFLPLTPDFQVDLNQFDKNITPQTKLLCLSHVSNVLGVIQPLKEIISQVKKINPKILVVVDGAQAVPHFPVDVQDLGADFYTFSGHKLFGPTGIGVLWGKRGLLEQLPPFHYGGGMILDLDFTSSNHYQSTPAKFEAGTPPIAEAIGLAAGINFLNSPILDTKYQILNTLTSYALTQLQSIKDLKIYGPLDPTIRASVITFNIPGIHPHDLAQLLGSQNICIRAGHHCTLPLHRHFQISASARISLSIYNNEEDIDKLVRSLIAAVKILKD